MFLFTRKILKLFLKETSIAEKINGSILNRQKKRKQKTNKEERKEGQSKGLTHSNRFSGQSIPRGLDINVFSELCLSFFFMTFIEVSTIKTNAVEIRHRSWSSFALKSVDFLNFGWINFRRS
jgi:hypothetical protein